MTGPTSASQPSNHCANADNEKLQRPTLATTRWLVAILENHQQPDGSVRIITDGRLLLGKDGMGAEVGHLRVVPDGHRCGCGNRGCLETTLAVPALRQADGPAPLAAAGGRLGSVLSPVVTTLGIADVVLYGPAELLDGLSLKHVRTEMTDSGSRMKS